MNRNTIRKLAPWSGIVYVVLEIVSTFLIPIDFMDEPGEIAEAFDDDGSLVFASAQALVVAAALLVWFSGTIASAIRTNGGGHRFAAIAQGGGVAAAAMLFGAAVVAGAGALRAEENAVDPQVAAVYADIAIIMAAAAAPAAMSVLVAATAAASLSGNRFIPWQLDWVSVLVAIALIALPINFAAVLAFFAWCVLLAVLMIIGRLNFEADLAAAA